jgi:hypothetical protein
MPNDQTKTPAPGSLQPAGSAIRESAIRTMRDRVYGQQTSDNNWEACKEDWLKPEQVRWLEDECARLDLPNKD